MFLRYSLPGCLALLFAFIVPAFAAPDDAPAEVTGGIVDTPDGCSGPGLTVPVVAVRNRGRSEPEFRGPVASGIGVGYYKALYQNADCSKSHGFNFFAISQGLAPTTDNPLQVGVGIGYGAEVAGMFNVGFGMMYDLVRFQRSSDPKKEAEINGLVTGKHLGAPSVSWVFVFSLTSDSPKTESDDNGG